jgi:Cys-tRNA synthase (O-phospho-L-seryl-tRNA:Cys-tRNA synthase)
MGKLAHVNKQPIKHEWFKYQTDELTRINSEAGRRDNLIYKERKARGFKD